MHIVSMNYPTARRDEDSKNCMHGVEIEDPYRQLENAFADETKAFVEAQNELTSRYLAQYPHSVGLNDTLGAFSSFLSVRAFQRAPDGRFYWECKADGVPQPVMRRCDGPIDPKHFTGEEGEVFFDVNLLPDDGRGTASFAWGSWSETGRYWATTISRGGSDRQSILIIDTLSKQQVDQELVDVKFCWALTWLGDEGFVYKHVPPKHPDDPSAEGGFKSAVHYIGSAQSSDVIIWEDPLNPQTSALVPEVSEDKKFLVVDFFRSTDPVSMLLVTPIKDRLGLNAERFTTPPVWTEQALPYDGTYRYLTTTSTGHSLFLTNRGSASRMKISSTVLGALASPPSSSSHPVWEDVIPEHPEGAVLGQAKALGQGLLLLVYSRDVGHELWIYTDDGRSVRQVEDNEIPRSSMVKAITRGKGSMEFSIECWSYIAPPTLYRGVVADGDVSFSIMHTASARGWNEPDYVQKQVFYKSKDGTMVPMHISHKRLLSLDNPHPTLLFGYGGFNWAQEPRWDPLFSAFMAKFDGVIAVAGIRGGGEYGVDWHQAAVKQKRQVAIDDFVAAAKWLKGEGKIASKLAIYGSSNGGLLCGAVCNQVPELIDAALPDVGVHDLLRFHLFTMGALWTAEYGNPKDVGDFQALLRLSPLHNVTNDLNYPAVFLTTAEHDSRVIPGHTLKLAATLQAKKTQNPAPILCRIYQNTGHGDGKTTDQQIREHAEKLTFLARAMELEYVE